MSNSVETTGKTVNEAILLALSELGLDESEKDKVDIEVLDEGSKGIFGLIGSKMARVRATLKETGADYAKEFLSSVIEKIGVNAELLSEEQDDNIYVELKGEDIGILIGRRGETLDALQYLTSLVVNKNSNTYKRVILDTKNYRKKREETLVKLAERLAERVVRHRKTLTLEPMNPYERRIIHSALQNNKHVRTYSVGDEPNRKVVITTR